METLIHGGVVPYTLARDFGLVCIQMNAQLH